MSVINLTTRTGVVAASLLLALTGCASGGGDAEEAEATTPAPSASAAPAEKVDEPAVADDETPAPPTQDAPSEAPATDPGEPEPSELVAVADGTCAASRSEQTPTSTGALPVSAYACTFASVAPDAEVVFVRWPDAASAQAYYFDMTQLGPRIETFDRWNINGNPMGPLWTNESEGRTLSTGLYEGDAYTWQIRTTTLDESNDVFGKVSPVAVDQLRD